jgi:hypothetical protein
MASIEEAFRGLSEVAELHTKTIMNILKGRRRVAKILKDLYRRQNEIEERLSKLERRGK